VPRQVIIRASDMHIRDQPSAARVQAGWEVGFAGARVQGGGRFVPTHCGCLVAASTGRQRAPKPILHEPMEVTSAFCVEGRWHEVNVEDGCVPVAKQLEAPRQERERHDAHGTVGAR